MSAELEKNEKEKKSSGNVEVDCITVSSGVLEDRD